MKRHTLIVIMLASILLTLSSGVALAAKENATMPVEKNVSVNKTMPDNMSMSGMVMPKMKIKIPMNMSASMNTSKPMNMAMNVFILQNATLNIITMQNMTLRELPIVGNSYNATTPISNQKILTKKVPAIKVASLWSNGLPFNETVPKAFDDLMKLLTAKGLPMTSGAPMAIYYDDPHSLAPENIRFKVAVPVPTNTTLMSEGRMAVEELPEREVAYITVYGPYNNLEDVYSQLNTWVYQNGYNVSDAPREVYVNWGEAIPSADMITEIQFPITR